MQSGIGAIAAWFTLRRSMRQLLLWVYLPWFMSAAATTAALVLSVGADSIEAPSRAAWSIATHPFLLGLWLWLWNRLHKGRTA
jgi:hypothetical protein